MATAPKKAAAEKRAPAKRRKTKKPAARKRQPRGRPPVWSDSYIQIAHMLAQLGATDLDVSNAFGVDIRTIYRWKLERPEFREALVVGKEAADGKVEESLYRLATGYTFDEEQIMSVGGEIQRIQTKKHIPPNGRSIEFWLLNRRPDLWRQTKHIKHDVEPESPLKDFLDQISGRSIQPKIQSPADTSKGTALGPKTGTG